MSPSNLIKCAVYVRVSTDHDDQERSAENQAEDIPRKIRESGRGEVVNIYVDQGITGTKAERPQFQKMIEDARAGCFDYIVVKNISRFARNVLISIEYIKELKALQHPVGIYFIEEGLNTLQPGVDFVLTVLSAVAEQESQNISNHVRATFNSKIEQGQKVNGSSPYGYDCITNKDGQRTLKPNKDAQVVKKIFEDYLNEQSTTDISRSLRRQGINKRATTIAKILHNEVYTGDLKQRKQQTAGVRGKRYISPEDETITIKGHHEPIISQIDFERVQEMMKRTGRGRRAQKEYAFTGLIHCGRCGRVYQRHDLRDGHGWVCSSAQKRYNNQVVDCPGKKWKTTHEDTLFSLYEQSLYFLNYLIESSNVFFTTDQKRQITTALEDFRKNREDTNIKEYVMGITIGTKDIDRIIKFAFIFNIDVIFKTADNDTRYKRAECSIEIRS